MMSMRQIVALGVLAWSSASALAQNFRLDLLLVVRDVSTSGVVTDIATGGIVRAAPGVYRVELRYRIADLTADTTISRGLCSTNIRIAAQGPGATNASWFRAPLTNSQATHAPGTTPPNPDTTGLSDGATGLIEPFRNGLTSDVDPANGGPTLAFPSFSTVPLALSAPVQTSPPSCTGPNQLCDPNVQRPSWGIFAFNVVYPGNGRLRIDASSLADPETGNRFGHFVRTGSVNSPVPTTSTLATDAFIVLDSCPGDYNADGNVSAQDVFAFLNDWFAGSASADINLSRSITLQDVFDFLNAWFNGCA